MNQIKEFCHAAWRDAGFPNPSEHQSLHTFGAWATVLGPGYERRECKGCKIAEFRRVYLHSLTTAKA